MNPIDGADRRIQLRLYVAGNSPQSIRATANLKQLQAAFPEVLFDIEVVDILEEPLRPLRDQVSATPTLLRLYPVPTIHIVGDLGDRDQVCAQLGLQDGH